MKAAWRRFLIWLGLISEPAVFLCLKDIAGAVSAVPEFDWLRDYGASWRPGDTAVWLAPQSFQEMADWHARHRPFDYGIKSTPTMLNDMTIELLPPVRQRRATCLGL